MFWEAENLNPCWTQEVDLQRTAARRGGPGSHQGTAVLLMAGAGETPLGIPVLWQSWRSWHTPDAWPGGSAPGLPCHPWTRVTHLVTSKALPASCCGGRVDGCSISLPKLLDFPRNFFYPQDFLFKNMTFRICIFPAAGKTIFTKLPQISQNVYSICFMALGICYNITPPPLL